MEIVEPRKIYENWRSASVHEIRTKCLKAPINFRHGYYTLIPNSCKASYADCT